VVKPLRVVCPQGAKTGGLVLGRKVVTGFVEFVRDNQFTSLTRGFVVSHAKSSRKASKDDGEPQR
jgi:hypothetical protein